MAGDNAWLEIYGLVSLSKLRLFSPELLRTLADHNPYEDLGLDVELSRMKSGQLLSNCPWLRRRSSASALPKTMRLCC